MSKYTWKDQYDRVIRHYNRITNNTCKYINNESELFDDFLNFCIHCFHLYEWIDLSIHNTIAKDFALTNKYIVLCGGVANHTKHLRVDRFRNELYSKNTPYRIATFECAASSTEFSGKKSDLHIKSKDNEETTLDLSIKPEEKLIVFIDEERYVLLDILEKSITAWDNFISAHSLNN